MPIKEEPVRVMLNILVGLVLILLCVKETSAQGLQVDLNLVKATVAQWSEAHNSKDRNAFEDLYAPTLLYYAKQLPREKCIQIKFTRLNSGKPYSQRIVSSLVNTGYLSGIIKCEFTKEVNADMEVTEYRSYLLLERKNNAYQIVGESDLTTDTKLNYKLDLGPQYKINDLELVDFSQTKYGISLEMFTMITWLLSASILSVILIHIYLKLTKNKRKKAKSFLSGNRMPSNKIREEQEFIYRPIERVKWKQYPMVRQRKLTTASENKSRILKSGESFMSAIKQKGDEFEAYVFERFDRNFFTIRYWNGDLSYKGYYPESNMYPDLEIEYKFKDFKRTFAVECKYRSKLVNNSFELETRQLDNYRKYGQEKSIRVYIAVGLYGEPSNPKKLYLIPLEIFAKRNSLSSEELAKFERGTKFFRYDSKFDMLS